MHRFGIFWHPTEHRILFEKLRRDFTGYLTSTLWKLTGDTDIFAEAFQYSLLGIWMNLEKLTGPQAGAYIYRIALSANSKAKRSAVPASYFRFENVAGTWRNRTGKDSFMQLHLTCCRQDELLHKFRRVYPLVWLIFRITDYLAD